MKAAEQEFVKTVELNSDFAAAHYNLGLLHLKRKQTAKAIKQFREAVRLNPDDTAAHRKLKETLKDIEESAQP